MDGEGLASDGAEFEYTGERNDVLRNWIVMPVKGGMRRRFLEQDRLRIHQFAPVYTAAHDVRIPVRPPCTTDKLESFSVSLVMMLLMFKISAVSARSRWANAGFSMSD